MKDVFDIVIRELDSQCIIPDISFILLMSVKELSTISKDAPLNVEINALNDEIIWLNTHSIQLNLVEIGRTLEL